MVEMVVVVVVVVMVEVVVAVGVGRGKYTLYLPTYEYTDNAHTVGYIQCSSNPPSPAVGNVLLAVSRFDGVKYIFSDDVVLTGGR